jgi:hypothetical protein
MQPLARSRRTLPGAPPLPSGLFSLALRACLRQGHLCHPASFHFWPRLVHKFSPKFYYVKRRFSITSKCRQMHGLLNVDEIKN